jgi:exoribonuclease-2
VKLGEIDLITLDVHGTVTERLDVAPEPLESEEDTEDEIEAGPIAIAVDVSESNDTPGADAPTAS